MWQEQHKGTDTCDTIQNPLGEARETTQEFLSRLVMIHNPGLDARLPGRLDWLSEKSQSFLVYVEAIYKEMQ